MRPASVAPTTVRPAALRPTAVPPTASSPAQGQTQTQAQAQGSGVVSVLVVAGDAAAAQLRVRDLQRQGYTVSSVDTGAKALAAHQSYDMVLLDLDLPDLDGLEVCRLIRRTGDKPIISIATRDTELDRVLALQAGADDCVLASCGIREMLARIEAVLRRAHPRPQVSHTISLSPLHIDGTTREVRLDGRPVVLTAKEFDLLHTLAADPKTVLSRKELMARVWDTTWAASTRTIDTHVSNLRAKLGGKWIITVHGVGYRLGRG
ncbi:response regulator transcription factor [Kitasatospora sp. A2-31]|uniref:response regulator transcription factor n=1 Tax=Kitasatospora sp. A2-31 TaxID=2916414 RepID=UPI0027E30425|nr:response regulator transcription factor [Kitasatospora sp. A2-31]